MDSSSNNDQSSIEENLRTRVIDEAQEVLNAETKSAETKELPRFTNVNDITLDNLALSNNNSVGNNTNEVNNLPSPTLRRTIGAFYRSFNSVQEGLSATCQSNDILPDDCTQPVLQFQSSTHEQQSEDQVVNRNPTTTNDNLQIPPLIERHIMISYNRESSSEICTNICDRLEKHGYKVWMDKRALHGKILNGMAKAVENSYIVLMCYNEMYSQSDFCEIETTYAFGKQIDLIPCRLQESYNPDGWLGSIATTRLYIDFSSPDDFEKSFEELIKEIEYIKANPQSNRYRWTLENNRNLQVYNEKKREQFNNLIREFKESINQNDDDLQSLTKEELCQLVNHIRERLFNDTLSTSDTDDRNRVQQNRSTDPMIRNLFEQSQNQIELLRKITEILSNPIDSKTIIKLALVVLFIWTFKTHIIDAYIKHK